jgi:hypothetical protein
VDVYINEVKPKNWFETDERSMIKPMKNPVKTPVRLPSLIEI